MLFPQRDLVLQICKEHVIIFFKLSQLTYTEKLHLFYSEC
jgi:hypothetical protein